ncbi:MAG: YdcF family protein, partial [Candidatus Omnitrophica bacterium]|nr:YdcF family protein [Candidatus Omnitrophota bacterium]
LEGVDKLAGMGVKWPTPIEMSVSALLQLGVPEEMIIVQPKYTDGTFSEAIEIHKILANLSYERVILVTDQYHARRAYLTFSTQLQKSGIKVFSSPSSYDMVFPEQWWLYGRDRSYVISEWIKIIYYWLILDAFE